MHAHKLHVHPHVSFVDIHVSRMSFQALRLRDHVLRMGSQTCVQLHAFWASTHYRWSPTLLRLNAHIVEWMPNQVKSWKPILVVCTPTKNLEPHAFCLGNHKTLWAPTCRIVVAYARHMSTQARTHVASVVGMDAYMCAHDMRMRTRIAYCACTRYASGRDMGTHYARPRVRKRQQPPTQRVEGYFATDLDEVL